MSSYRDDLEAAQARAEALDREVAELREKNAALERRAQTAESVAKAATAEPAAPAPSPPRERIVQYFAPMPDPPTSKGPPWPWWRKLGLVGFIVCMVACAVSIPNTREDMMQVWDYIMLTGAVLGGLFAWLALGAPAEA